MGEEEAQEAGSGETHPAKVTEIELRRLYCDEKLSTHKIAKKMGLSPSSVYYLMKKKSIKLRTVHNRPISTPRKNTLAFIAGAIAGDGHIGKTFCTLESIDEEFVDDIYRKLSEFSEPTKRTRYRKDKKKNIYVVQLSRKSFIKPLTNFNFSRSSKEEMIEFVNGFCDAEGTVGMEGISISNTDIRLLTDISIFLKGLGIHNNIYRNGNQHNYKALYRISIIRRNAVIRFSKFFRFSIRRKQKLLNHILDSYRVKSGGDSLVTDSEKSEDVVHPDSAKRTINLQNVSFEVDRLNKNKPDNRW